MSLQNSQFYGANFSYLRHRFDYFVASMQRLGVEHIEFYAASPHLYLENATVQDVRKLAQTLRQANIRVNCFTAEQCLYPVSLASADDRLRSRSVAYYEKALAFAQELQSPFMQMISGCGFLEDESLENRKRSMDGIAHLVNLAERAGIRIALEADPNCTIANTADQVSAIREISSPNLVGMIDTNALALNGESFSYAADLLGKNLCHIHFIDIDILKNRMCLAPGDGVLPMISYLEALSARNYTGGITPELWGTTYHHCAEQAMEKSLAYLRAYRT